MFKLIIDISKTHLISKIKQTIIAGPGISVLSQHTVAQKAAMDQLTILDVEHFPIKRKWYVVYLAAKLPTIIARTFLEYLRSHSE